jgi:hypothetical protein
MACSGHALAQSGSVTKTTGPDVIVGDLPDISNNPASGLYDSVAVGTTSCNRGDTPLNWFTGSGENRHPAISQNVYRLMNGRFEQVGQGWLKHGFTALQNGACNTYFNFGCASNPNGTALGVGCSDPYSSGLNNGGANSMGPKWQVNAANGLFPYSFAASPMSAAPRVRLADLNAGVEASARWFVEGQYICGDDAAATTNGNSNKWNNASWREISWTAAAGAVPTATNFNATLTTNQVVHREQPAVYAWQAADPSVFITTYDVPGDGRFVLACKVSGTGPYTYEYALHNLNSHRCAGSFTVPLPGAQNALSAVGFHDAEAVGEPNGPSSEVSMPDPTADDWAVAGGGANASSIAWSGAAYAGSPPSYTVDPTTAFRVASYTAGTGNDHTANVIRWGTMFNFRFTSEIAPVLTGSVAAGLFRPGAGIAIVIGNVPTPGGAVIGGYTASCCISGACSVTTQAACAGAWGLPGTSCAPDPCPLGVCCSSGVCSITVHDSCAASWTLGGSCTPNPCPAPTGACCANNTCTVVTQPACATGYQGDNTTCATTACPQANNPCSGAQWIADNAPIAGSTAAATNDYSAGTLCGSSQGSSDVWYKYKPVTAGGVAFNLCGSSYDTVIAVFSGSCGALTQLACNDDSYSGGNNACGNGNLGSGLNYTLAASSTYLIRVSGYSGASGNYTLTVVGGGGIIPPSAPANDTCSAAASASVGAIVFSNVGAGTDGPTHAACDFNASNQITGDVWYTHVGTINGALRVDTCTGAGFDTRIAVYSGTTCPGSDAALLACNDDSACGSGRSKVSIPVTRNAAYLIRVGGTSGATGAGTLTLSVCGADFNGDGGLSVGDIFDYLNAWFAGQSRADFNLSGSLSVQDIFDYLNAWFTGGC